MIVKGGALGIWGHVYKTRTSCEERWGGASGTSTCPEICMCMRFRVSVDAHLIQDSPIRVRSLMKRGIQFQLLKVVCQYSVTIQFLLFHSFNSFHPIGGSRSSEV